MWFIAGWVAERLLLRFYSLRWRIGHFFVECSRQLQRLFTSQGRAVGVPKSLKRVSTTVAPAIRASNECRGRMEATSSVTDVRSDGF